MRRTVTIGKENEVEMTPPNRQDTSKKEKKSLFRKCCPNYRGGIPITLVVFLSAAFMVVAASLSVWGVNFQGAVSSTNEMYVRFRNRILLNIRSDFDEHFDGMELAADMIRYNEPLLFEFRMPTEKNETYDPTTLARILNGLRNHHVFLSIGIQVISPHEDMPRSSYDVAIYPLCEEYTYAWQDYSIWPIFSINCLTFNGTVIQPPVFTRVATTNVGANANTLTVPRFSDIWILNQEFMISWELPVYRGDQVYGSAFAQNSLLQIDSFLQTLRTTENGVVYVVEKDTGLLVSASIPNQTSIFYMVGDEWVGVRFRASSERVSDFRIREASRRIEARVGSWSQIQSEQNFEAELDGTDCQISVIPYDRVNLYWAIVLVVPTNDIMGNINKSTRNSLIISAAVIVISLIITIIWTHFVVRRLTQIARSMERISRLEFDTDLHQKRRKSSLSEIRTIEESFSTMHRGVRSFSKYVPYSVVRGLLVGQHNSELGVKPARVTIMFIDLKGFTSVCEYLNPYNTAKVLGDFLIAMSNVIIKNRGTVDKFIGDSVMAFWNAPEEVPNHSAAACLAALECHSELKSLHMKWSEEQLPLLEMRIGIHTDDVLVGNVGSPERMNYTIIGDGVNLASRMESLGKTYGLTSTLVTETVVQNNRDHFLFYMLGNVFVPGRSQTTEVHQLVCRVEDAHPIQWEIANLYHQLSRAVRSSDSETIVDLCTELTKRGENNSYILQLIEEHQKPEYRKDEEDQRDEEDQIEGEVETMSDE